MTIAALIPRHPLAPLHIAWIARCGSLDALRAAGVSLAGHATAVTTMAAVLKAELACLGEFHLSVSDRPAAAAHPVLWAQAVLMDAGLITA